MPSCCSSSFLPLSKYGVSMGLAVTIPWYLRKNSPIIGVFETYIHLFWVKIGHIRNRSFSKFISPRRLTYLSPQSFRAKLCFYFFHKLLFSNCNSTGPLTISNIAAIRQWFIHPFFMRFAKRIIRIIACQVCQFFMINEYAFSMRRLDFIGKT